MDPDILAVRKELLHAYVAVAQDEENAQRWIDVNVLENTLSSLEFARASRGNA